MTRFLVLNQPFFDGHPGVPGSPMYKVYLPEPGRWKDDIDPNMQDSVVVEVEDYIVNNPFKVAFIKAMGIEPLSQTGVNKNGVCSCSVKMTNPKTGADEWKHIWVIKLS